MAETRGTEAGTLARVAGRQLGLVTAAQLATMGLSRETVRRRTRAGVLRRAGARVYAVGGSPCTWEQAALAACLDLGADAVLSHTSAAALWRLDVCRELPVHLTVPAGRNVGRAQSSLVLHRSKSWAAGERTRIGQLPATGLTRTILDLAAVLSPDVLAAVVDDALCRRLLAPDRLLAALDLHARERRHGIAALRGVLAPWVPGGGALESVAEARFLRAVRKSGLPAPVLQHHIEGEHGFLARTDFAWPDRMVALEVDSFRWHANPRAHARDSQRVNRLAACGWTVLHATPAELETSPAVVLAALRRHLSSLGRAN